MSKLRAVRTIPDRTECPATVTANADVAPGPVSGFLPPTSPALLSCQAVKGKTLAGDTNGAVVNQAIVAANPKP